MCIDAGAFPESELIYPFCPTAVSNFCGCAYYFHITTQRHKYQFAMVSLNEVIIAVLDGIQPDAFGGDEVERLKVRAAARRLLARVETPYERAWGFCFEHPIVFAALQTCIDVGLWKTWTSIGGGEKSIDELVAMTTPNVETNLLRKSPLIVMVMHEVHI